MSTGDPTVRLEHVIVEGPDETLVRQMRTVQREEPVNEAREILGPVRHVSTRIAPGATRAGVPPEAYHAYRKGLASACADVVLVARRGGVPKVPLIKRARPPFGDCWWIMGGVVFNYRPIQQFLLWKACVEFGLTADTLEAFAAAHSLADDQYGCRVGDRGELHIIGCLGAYRTAAEDTTDPERVCDTINLCYMGILLGNLEILYDKDHTNCRWASEEEFTDGSCGYWYPEHVGRRALQLYRQGMY